MKEQINRLLRIQTGSFIALWACPILLVILYETGVLPEGTYTGDAQMEYIMQSASILLTIGLIPFSLRLFSLNLVKRIKELPLAEALKSYRIWSDIRYCLLFVPAMLSMTFYYLTLNTTGLFCAAIALIASLFCVPTYNRIANELDLPETIED